MRICNVACMVLGLGVAAVAARGQEPARCADEFVDSIGVVVHFNYNDTPYGNFDLMRQRIGELGVRHLREGSDRPYVFDFMKELHRTYGIRFNLISDFGEKQQALIREHSTPQAIEAIEGPNETDLFPFNYQGQGFPGGLVAYQKDLYRRVKESALGARLPVIGPSFARGGSELKVAPLTAMDWTCMHSYAGGGVPSSNLDAGVMPASTRILGKPAIAKPIVATECGYHTAYGMRDEAQPGVPEEVQAKYIPRLFAEYFLRGVVRAYTYELIDEFPDPKNSEARYGLLHRDGTPKPAFTAEKNLIALLKDPGPTFAPRALDFELAGGAPNVRHLVLQKRNGDYYLLLWQEVSGYENERSRSDYGTVKRVPEVPVTLRLRTPISAAELYLPNDSPAAVKRLPAQQALSLSVPDRLLIVRLRPVRKPIGGAPAAPRGLTGQGTASSIQLRWQAPAGPRPAGYFVWRLGRFLGRATAPAFLDARLPAGLGYPYEVAAYDAAGRISKRATVIASTKAVFPDLQIESVSWSPAEPGAGAAVTFEAVVRNAGTAPTPEGTTIGVAFFVDDKMAGWSDTFHAALAPGGTVRVVVNNGPANGGKWQAVSGAHKVRAIVDDVNRIDESNEENNTLERAFTVKTP